MSKLNRIDFVHQIIVTIIIFLFEVTDQKHFHSVQGPWKIESDKLERCPPKLAGLNAIRLEPPVLRSGLSGQPNFFSGNIVIEYPISDDLSVEFHPASQSSRGGWISYRLPISVDNVCRKAKSWVPKLFARILNSSDDIQPKDCPLREGSYRTQHMEFYLDGSEFPHFPVLQYKKVRADIVFLMANNRSANVGCIRLFLTIKPK